MPWEVVERKIGRAGGVRQRTARQREWDQKYGERRWAVGYVVDGTFVLQEHAVESIYDRSYEDHFAAHPEDLEELIRLAKTVRNPHVAPAGRARASRGCPRRASASTTRACRSTPATSQRSGRCATSASAEFVVTPRTPPS
jgi:hypothetical protein